MKLDAFDIKILNILQVDNQITSAELAERVNLSSASCLRRVRRLREEKVIKADVSIVAPELVGRGLTIIATVSLERERLELLDNFKRSIQVQPEVMQCYYVTGEVDFIIVIHAADLADYERFTKKFFFDNPNVQRFSTMVVLDRVKTSTAIPIESPEGE